MASDREEEFKQAERLLRQGKIDAAASHLDGLVKKAPRDLLLLNRCGDLLARTKQGARAIPFYEKLADQYAHGGFLPKAIAIYKKALKLDSDRAQLLAKIGELYMTQEHAGEARSYLLRAADRHLGDRNFTAARDVYKRLVVLDPEDPRHRARLAEARAAAGETEPAGQELLALGDSLLGADKAGDAERAYQRAAELLKNPFEASAGRAFSLARQDRLIEALDAVSGRSATAAPETVAGVRAALLEVGGRSEDAVKVLRESAPGETHETFLKWMRKGSGRSDLVTAWERLDAAMESHGSPRERIELLGRLGETEPHGHLPALERLYAVQRDEGGGPGAASALERLIRALQARSMDGEARQRLEELRAIAPHSELVTASAPLPPSPARPATVGVPPAIRPAPVRAAASAPRPAPAAPPPSAATSSRAESDLAEAEAPAVPLAPADEEFVRGHLTEAEVLQKYGLASEALQRLRTVTGRFPGHVEAQVKLAALLRSQGGKAELTEVLFRLAVARRAAGDNGAAREAAAEAAKRPGLPQGQRTILERLGLIEVTSTPKVPPAARSAGQEASDGEADASEAIAADESASAAAETEDEVEIVFGSEPSGEAEADDRAPAAAAAAEGRVPPEDVLNEIGFYREQGMLDEARRKLSALRTLGYAGARLDDLETVLRGAEASGGQARPAGTSPEDGDLADLTAALDAELTDSAAGAAGPEAGEESLEDVFQAFKRQVEDEVGSEDYRTHYDLGIAYKEMGLLADALREFEVAAASPELFREACSMLALCQRERGEIDEAVRWYERALEAPGASTEELQGLRYDLADTLLLQGEDQAALDLFQNILDSDPGYRDVRSRVSDLRSRRDS
jgi:tetratricopeptide (TPR) repeat protein